MADRYRDKPRNKCEVLGCTRRELCPPPIIYRGEASKGNDSVSPIDRLERVESALLSLLQEVRSVKVELQQQASKGADLEPLLEAEDVAKILGVDVGYVYAQARDAKMPSIKLGKYRKFSPSQLKKWLDRNIS